MTEVTSIPSNGGLEGDKDLHTGSSVEETAAGRSHIAASASSVDETGMLDEDLYSASSEGPSSDSRGETGIQLNLAAAKWPEYANRIERLDSYKTWPKPNLDVNALVEAGMFYKGDEDRTECFYCGIPLKLWDIYDDPWIEHARFSQDCQFLHFHKGWAFVKAVLEFYDLPTVGIPMRWLTNSMPHYRTADSTTQTSFEQQSFDNLRNVRPRPKKLLTDIEPREISARLDMDHVKRLISLGYPKALVGHVIAVQLQLEGDDFESFRDLACSVVTAALVVGVPLHTSRSNADQNSDQPSPLHEVREIHGSGAISRPGPYNQRAIKKKMTKKNNLKGQDLFCKYCRKKEVNVIFKDCGHIVLCNDCVTEVHICPKCRKYIKQKVMLYVE